MILRYYRAAAGMLLAIAFGLLLWAIGWALLFSALGCTPQPVAPVKSKTKTGQRWIDPLDPASPASPLNPLNPQSPISPLH